MVLPVSPNPISATQINTELGRTSTAAITLNDLEVKTLAKVGNTSLANTAGATTDFDSLRGTARARITPTANATGINLRTLTTNYATGKTYSTYFINNGIVIGSTSTGTPALTVGSFASGDLVEISVAAGGYIVGCGGQGGKGKGGFNNNVGSADPGTNGTAGGTALFTRFATFVNNLGNVWGGGGGGGGGGGDNTGGKSREPEGGGGGGGGAGQNGGVGGDGGTNSNAFNGQPGSPGTLGSGGAGGAGINDAGVGGTGGGPGAAGSTGGTSTGNGDPGTAGGAAGNYVDGSAFVTWVSVGSRLGGAI